jgi:hypothetical protein
MQRESKASSPSQSLSSSNYSFLGENYSHLSTVDDQRRAGKMNNTTHLSNIAHDDAQAVKEVRKLIIDICRQNGGGHGGSAISMAPMAVALRKYTMRFNPHNPHVSFSTDGSPYACYIEAHIITESGSIETDLCCQTGMLRCCCTVCYLHQAIHI